MKSLRIEKINAYGEYILIEDETKKIFSLILEFYSNFSPKVDDVIVINEKLLDRKFEGFCQPYAFKDSNKKVKDFGEELEHILIHTKDNKNFVLERIYG